MSEAPIPPDEKARLASLRAYGVLDTPEEQRFDALVRLAADICEAPMAVVNFVDENRTWSKAKVGVSVSEAPRSASFCAHAILEEALFVVPDTVLDRRFSRNPYVTGTPAIRFYAGMPFRGREGYRMGSLCVLDTVPRELTDAQQKALRALSRQVESELELQRTLRELTEACASSVRENAALKQLQSHQAELTTFLVHDLKNPLASLMVNAQFLDESPGLSPEARGAVGDMISAASILHQRVLNVLDISRSDDRGMRLRPVRMRPDEVFQAVAHDMGRRVREQGRTLHFHAGVPPVEILADAGLFRRVLENLVGNALEHTPPGSSIWLEAEALGDGSAEVRVRDEGPGIAARNREHIFEKYAQLEAPPASHSADAGNRGLGLAFCRRVMTAHGGRIWVDANRPHGTVFHLSWPASLQPI